MTQVTQLITANDDEKIDEYLIWTQYIDHNRAKPSSAFQLSVFTKQTNTITSITMSIAKNIFNKYKNTYYQPSSKSNYIPKKKLWNPIHTTFHPPTLVKAPKKKLYHPIQQQTHSSSSSFNGLAKKQFSTGICQICLEEKNDIVTTNKCHHKLCKTCMRRYIKLAPNKLQIKCPEFKCLLLLSQYHDIKCVLTHIEYAEMYLKKLINKLSYCSGEIICLTDTCFNRMVKDNIIDGKLECNCCNHSWCINCNSVWHEGLSCDESYYARQNNISSILLNCEVKTIGYVTDVPKIRSCPCCKEAIEHTVRCKHMYCKCGISFCFVCLELYDVFNGKWKCGGSSTICPTAPRQLTST